MKSRLGHLWVHHKFLFLSFALAFAVTVFFALRAVVFFVYWSDPNHRYQPLEPWMTLGYVAHSYDLSREQMLLLVELPKAPRLRPTLKWVAKSRGIPVEQLISELSKKLESPDD